MSLDMLDVCPASDVIQKSKVNDRRKAASKCLNRSAHASAENSGCGAAKQIYKPEACMYKECDVQQVW